MGLGPGKRGPAGGRSGEGDEWDAGQEDGPQGTAGAGGGTARRGSYFPEGDVLPFTTLKRFCTNLSPQ